MTDPRPFPQPPRLSVRLLLAAAAVAVLMLGAATAFYIITVKVPTDLAQTMAAGIREIFHVTPRVTIDQTVIIEQNTPILEVATVTRDLFVEHTWAHTWLGSTKQIRLQGAFTAKAGFNLREPFEITIEQNPLTVSTIMPASRLLSIEMKEFRVIQDESGWWNRVSGADRERAVRELQQTARLRAETSGILAEAERTAQERVREIVERNGAVVEFRNTAGQ